MEKIVQKINWDMPFIAYVKNTRDFSHGMN